MIESRDTVTPEEAALHGGDETSLAVRIYCQMMDNLVKKQSPRHQRLQKDAEDLLRRIDPQDPIEQMLSEQIIWMHARLAFLNYFASIQTKKSPMQLMHSAADRLANTLRRHMMAFADYRNPGRKRFTAVRQANIAHQQIVSNHSQPAAEKLDDPQISRSISETASEKISPDPRRAAIAAPQRRQEQTMAEKHRPADDGGQEAIQPEPPDPRPIHP
jgi:hypothetical protein